MKLSLLTYELGKELTLDELLAICARHECGGLERDIGVYAEAVRVDVLDRLRTVSVQGRRSDCWASPSAIHIQAILYCKPSLQHHFRTRLP